jgi:hypothetical protein
LAAAVDRCDERPCERGRRPAGSRRSGPAQPGLAVDFDGIGVDLQLARRREPLRSLARRLRYPCRRNLVAAIMFTHASATKADNAVTEAYAPATLPVSSRPTRFDTFRSVIPTILSAAGAVGSAGVRLAGAAPDLARRQSVLPAAGPRSTRRARWATRCAARGARFAFVRGDVDNGMLVDGCGELSPWRCPFRGAMTMRHAHEAVDRRHVSK